MTEQVIAEKPIASPSDRGAELVGAIIESIKLVDLLAIQQLGLHSTRTILVKDAQTSRNASAIRFAQEEEERSEQACENTRAELKQALRKLERIKLSLEGKTSDEIEAYFAQKDEMLQYCKDRLDAIGK
jgi:hypothetical protein